MGQMQAGMTVEIEKTEMGKVTDAAVARFRVILRDRNELRGENPAIITVRE